MNVNFHLANGSAHPWLIPSDGFDEGVDLDSFMPGVQLVLAFVSVSVWKALRRQTATARKSKLQVGSTTERETTNPA